MHEKLFYAPVSIKLGEGVDTQIVSLSDMEQFLESWPEFRRGKLYQMAVKAHSAARDGYITMDQARRALVTFVEATGMLRSELEQAVSSRAVVRGYGGFAA
jgi:hypothetical protein